MAILPRQEFSLLNDITVRQAGIAAKELGGLMHSAQLLSEGSEDDSFAVGRNTSTKWCLLIPISALKSHTFCRICQRKLLILVIRARLYLVWCFAVTGQLELQKLKDFETPSTLSQPGQDLESTRTDSGPSSLPHLHLSTISQIESPLQTSRERTTEPVSSQPRPSQFPSVLAAMEEEAVSGLEATGTDSQSYLTTGDDDDDNKEQEGGEGEEEEEEEEDIYNYESEQETDSNLFSLTEVDQIPKRRQERRELSYQSLNITHLSDSSKIEVHICERCGKRSTTISGLSRHKCNPKVGRNTLYTIFSMEP